MSKENGIIDAMGLDKIQSEIKNTAVELEKVNSGIEDFTGKISAIC